MNLNVVFMGTPEFASVVLKSLIPKVNVVLVVTNPDKEVGRKKEISLSPTKKTALDHNIPVFQPSKIRTDYSTIKEYNPDLIITCAYGQIIPKEVLDIPRLGCINVHASLLPKYRGGAPIEHALMNGEDKTGITIMYMDEGLDTGDIISTQEIPILLNDTTSSLKEKLSVLGADLLLKTLPDIINGTNKRIKQDSSLATYAKIIKREDEHIDFNTKAVQVFNKVRALSTEPLANFLLNNEEYKILEGFIGENTNTSPGTIVKITKDAIGISTLDKIYYITKLKPFGKKAMLTKDYLNGIKKENILNKKVS